MKLDKSDIKVESFPDTVIRYGAVIPVVEAPTPGLVVIVGRKFSAGCIDSIKVERAIREIIDKITL